MPLISIIVPAYNSEDTLSLTINDILKQSFIDFELIIVNDGSTDTTQDICEKYLNVDERIRVIKQENGGLSNARNNGTRMATGDYVTYIDSDDRIAPVYLEYLVTAMKATHADMVCGRTDRIKEGVEPSGNIDDYSVEVFDQKESLKEMLTSRKITVGPCNRLVPRMWYQDAPFLEGKKYEDLSNSYKLHLKANSVAFVDSNIYHYVMRGGSITGAKTVSVQQCMDYYEAINMCSNGVIEVYDDLESYVAVLKYRDYMSLYLLICRCVESDDTLNLIKSEIIKWCKMNWKSVMGNQYAPFSVRLRALLFRLSPEIYKIMYYIGIRFKGKAIS